MILNLTLVKKRDDYFSVTFDHFWSKLNIFGCDSGKIDTQAKSG